MLDIKKIQQLDLNLLKVFQALYQEGNMTRTADVLNLTPSAVSHAIRRLRDTLGDPLFQRSQNKMLPTPACKRMAPLIIDNLTRLQQILQQWGDFTPDTSQYNFRVGMHDAFEPTYVPLLANALTKRAPNVALSSIKVDRNNLASDLSAGHVDLVLDVSLASKPPVKHIKLTENEFCVLMRRDHPLNEKLDQQTYLSATHLNVSNRPRGITVEDIYFQEQGLIRQTSIRCQNFLAARQILKTSNHLLTLAKLQANHLIDSELIIRPCPFAIPSFSTHLYWHENSDQDAALLWLRDLIIEILPNE